MDKHTPREKHNVVIAHGYPPSTIGNCIPVPDNTTWNVFCTLLRQAHVCACTCTHTHTQTHTKMREKTLLNQMFF